MNFLEKLGILSHDISGWMKRAQNSDSKTHVKIRFPEKKEDKIF